MIVTDLNALRIPSEPVADVREGGAIVRKLSAALERSNKRAVKVYRKNAGKDKTLTQSIGLSAPQIGIGKRVCIVRLGAVPIVLMNPVIVDASSSRFPYREGCLSLPGIEVSTWRHTWLRVKALNHQEVITIGPTTPEEWHDPHKLLTSAAVQHEVSHLFGMLMVDFTSEDSPSLLGLGAW